ncbi:unnamed protein product [Schistosoma turkestanicum]|nr:unnamed protein product [Schistosoma turkestanicum]
MGSLINREKKKPVGGGPNILFQYWITEAMEKAFIKDAKSYYAYRKALSSLKKYPLLLQSGKECKILEGFGMKLCDYLDEKLHNYANDLQLSLVEALHYGNKNVKASTVTSSSSSSSSTVTTTTATTTKFCNTNQLLPDYDFHWMLYISH